MNMVTAAPMYKRYGNSASMTASWKPDNCAMSTIMQEPIGTLPVPAYGQTPALPPPSLGAIVQLNTNAQQEHLTPHFFLLQ